MKIIRIITCFPTLCCLVMFFFHFVPESSGFCSVLFYTKTKCTRTITLLCRAASASVGTAGWGPHSQCLKWWQTHKQVQWNDMNCENDDYDKCLQIDCQARRQVQVWLCQSKWTKQAHHEHVHNKSITKTAWQTRWTGREQVETAG